MSLPRFDSVIRSIGEQASHGRKPTTTGSHERKAPPGRADLAKRVEKLSRGVLVGTIVAVGSVGFGVVSAVSAQMQIDKVTGNMRPAVVAVQTIEAGSIIAGDQVRLVEIPGAYLSDNASTDIGAFVGKAACVTIPANTQMGAEMIADLGNTSSLAAKIPAGKRAVTVNVTPSSGLSTLLRCGNTVQVYATARDSSLYQVASDVTVLALDGALAGPAPGVAYSTVTLQVTDAEAESIAAAEQDGAITLVLNPMSTNR